MPIRSAGTNKNPLNNTISPDIQISPDGKLTFTHSVTVFGQLYDELAMKDNGQHQELRRQGNRSKTTGCFGREMKVAVSRFG